MRVLHVITTIDRGGAEKAVLSLAKAQVLHGYDVSVLPLKGSLDLIDEFTLAKVKVLSNAINSSFIYQVLWVRSISKRFDIIHCHLPRAEICVRLARTLTPFLITRHNSERFAMTLKPFLSSRLSRWVTRKAKFTISISMAVEEFLLKNWEVDIPETSKIIYYGYEPKFFANRQYDIDAIDSHKVVKIGIVARLVHQKNIPMFLHIIKRLKMDGVHVEAIIVGDGEQSAKLKRLSVELDLDDCVKFVGKLSNVEELLQELDVFVLTSRYEGFGLVLLEAMDAGVPIVAVRNSAIPEVLGHSHPGLFPDEKPDGASLIIRHLQKIENVMYFRDFQKSQLSKFSIQKYFLCHEALYFQCINFAKDKV